MTPVHPTPYPELNDVLEHLVASIRAILDDSFTGAYLQGSFAIGDFDEHSDVDFIIAIERELTADQVRKLQGMHQRIFSLECPWAQHLEGSYFPKALLRQHVPAGEQLWYLDHGAQSLVESGHCNTVVVRWTLRHFGVVLAGPSPSALIDPIPVDVLRREVLATMNDWGQEILDSPQQYNNRFYQGFIVLSYCRMLHDLERGDPGSKRAGAEWAREKLDPRWAGLIDRAWDGRPDPARSVREAADPGEFKSTLAFVAYVLKRSTQVAADLDLDG